MRRCSLLFLLMAAALLTGCAGSKKEPPPVAPPVEATPKRPFVKPSPDVRRRPNIVFVMADDLSSNLLQFMPQVRRLAADGISFSNYFVTNSLCCPSRATLLTGQLPHRTGVMTNTPPRGGFAGFRAYGNERRSFALTLQRAGYRTLLAGKYLNGYERLGNGPEPGWSDWFAPGRGAYGGFNYDADVNGKTVHFGDDPGAYVTTQIDERTRALISSAARARQPFFALVTPFTPHRPCVPAPEDQARLRGLRAPRGPAFNAKTKHSPAWLERPRLSTRQLKLIDRRWRCRARSVLAIDRMIGRLRSALKAEGLAGNTYLLFGSDNGFHLGEYRLVSGKMTPFDTDVRVPLIAVGPGIAPGSQSAALTTNTDLAPTFLALAGQPRPDWSDGRSLVPLLRGQRVRRWRRAVLIEHLQQQFKQSDPDRQRASSGNPPSYEALRTATRLFVSYANGERSDYDLRTDPNELVNDWPELPQAKRAQLEAWLARLAHCNSGASCWRAGQ